MGRPYASVLLLVALVAHALMTEARYLPTRSQDDRLERLRELIRDLLENEVEKYNPNVPAELFAPERSYMFKPRQLPSRMMIGDEDRK